MEPGERCTADLTKRNWRPHEKSSAQLLRWVKTPPAIISAGFWTAYSYNRPAFQQSLCKYLVSLWREGRPGSGGERATASPTGSARAGEEDGFEPCGCLLGRDHTHKEPKEAGPPRRSWAERQTCLTWTARLRNVRGVNEVPWFHAGAMRTVFLTDVSF